MDFIRPTTRPFNPPADAPSIRSAADRRDSPRLTAAGALLIAWHHDHETPQEIGRAHV